MQRRVVRAMPARRKLQLVEDANRAARRLAYAGISTRHPELRVEQRERLLLELVLGEELAARAYGPRTFDAR